jgi:primase-polymerase (primpol)-like protein
LLRKQIQELASELDRAETDKEKGAIRKKLDEVVQQLERSIAIYGMINLRTDGNKAIIAQKLEKPISNAEKWDIHQLEPGPDGRLRYVSQ